MILLAAGALFSFVMGARAWRWQREHGPGQYWGGEQRRIDALAEACVRAAERVRSTP